MRHIRRKELGQSIVQVLVFFGILSILIVGLATILVNQQRESRALAEKLASLDLEKLLTASLADGSVCAYVLNNPTVLTFNANALPQTIVLPSSTLYTSIVAGPTPGPVAAQAGKPASPLSSTLIVNSISLQINSGFNGRYDGSWLINFDNTNNLIRPIQPVSIPNLLIVDDSIPAQAVTTACQGVGGGAANFQTVNVQFPGQPGGGGWVYLPPGSNPTAAGGYSPELLTQPWNYVPQGRRAEFIVQIGNEIDYTDVGQTLALNFNFHHKPAGGSDMPTQMGNTFFDPVTAGLAYAFGGTHDYHVVIDTTPGVSETITIGTTVFCYGGCPNAASASASVWSPVGLIIQEYY